MVRKPEDLVKGVVKLISLPEVYIRVSQILEDQDHNAKQLGEIISHDPALTARILRIVNSAYYSLSHSMSKQVSIILRSDGVFCLP